MIASSQLPLVSGAPEQRIDQGDDEREHDESHHRVPEGTATEEYGVARPAVSATKPVAAAVAATRSPSMRPFVAATSAGMR